MSTLPLFLVLYFGIAAIFVLIGWMWSRLEDEAMELEQWMKLLCLSLMWPMVIGFSMVVLAFTWDKSE